MSSSFNLEPEATAVGWLWFAQRTTAWGGDKFSTCRVRSLLLAAACLTLAGCNWHGNVVPVSGRVTLNGQPLKDATVSFQPVSPGANERPEAAGSTGKTDANGHFTLKLIDPDRAGALIGQHTVTISTAISGTGDAAPPHGERIPKAWRDGSQHFDVPAGGTAAANFDLNGT